MTREDKCKLFEAKGFKYNTETGEIFGIKKEVLKSNSSQGYIYMSIRHNAKNIKLYAHQFAWWTIYGEFKEESIIDHIDRNRSNNIGENLRMVSYLNNRINSIQWDYTKGYTFNKLRNKWLTRIKVNKKVKHLGYFSTEKEARAAYLAALAFYYPDRYKILEEKGLLNQI
jgi:hypothetical protein